MKKIDSNFINTHHINMPIKIDAVLLFELLLISSLLSILFLVISFALKFKTRSKIIFLILSLATTLSLACIYIKSPDRDFFGKNKKQAEEIILYCTKSFSDTDKVKKIECDMRRNKLRIFVTTDAELENEKIENLKAWTQKNSTAFEEIYLVQLAPSKETDEIISSERIK